MADHLGQFTFSSAGEHEGSSEILDGSQTRLDRLQSVGSSHDRSNSVPSIGFGSSQHQYPHHFVGQRTRRESRRSSVTPAEIYEKIQKDSLSTKGQGGDSAAKSDLSTISTTQVKEENHPPAQAEENQIPAYFDVLEKWNELAEIERKKKEAIAQRIMKEKSVRAGEKQYDDIYERLLESNKESQPPSPLSRILPDFLSNRVERPSDDELFRLVTYLFPPICDVEAHIFDFFEERMDHRKVKISELQPEWESKPSDVIVRWIHLPIGRGIVASSIEDKFLHCHKEKRDFRNSGDPTWPYLDTESLNFRNFHDFQKRRDIFDLLRPKHDDRSLRSGEKCSWMSDGSSGLQKLLNEASFKGFDPDSRLKADIKWRTGHINSKSDFWTMVECNLPFELADGVGFVNLPMISMYSACKLGPRRGLNPLNNEVSPQMLSTHHYFASAQMVRNEFRSFHSDDGFLLTHSAAEGIDFLPNDRDFRHFLEIPKDMLIDNPDASFLSRIAAKFKNSGVKSWHRRTTEWLLVLIMTDLAVCPHNLHAGIAGPTIDEAYQAVVLELNRRRCEDAGRQKTAELVNDYLMCIDELRFLTAVYSKRTVFLKSLGDDCIRMEQEDFDPSGNTPPDNPGENSTIYRIQKALTRCERSAGAFKRMHGDCEKSLEHLMSIRTIQQDELLRTADKQQKATLIFTLVAVIFIPLSFFTGYFGMNFKDIRDTSETSRKFWEIFGSIALVLVLLILLWAWAYHRWLGKRPVTLRYSQREKYCNPYAHQDMKVA